MLGKEIYVLCAGGGEVAMEGEFSLGNRPQRHSRMTRPIPVRGTHIRSDGCHSVKRRPSIDAWAGSKNTGTAVVGSLLA
jgi:hypothetical protein